MTTSSALDLDRDAMRALGRRVTDIVADHLSSLRNQRVHRPEQRRAVAPLISGPAPEEPTDADTLLDFLEQEVLARSSREPHPGFMAYVPSCPTFPAIAGDWLATGFNSFAGVWPVAPGPNQLELLVLEWFRTWLGMPEGASGILTSGGSAATMTAVVAARDAALAEDESVITRLVAYTSTQAHSSVSRAAWIAGISRANIRAIPVDEGYRMRMDALAGAIREDRARGMIPFLVVASAGTTNTGAVDPLREVAALCRRESLWFHADAAYAGFAVLTPGGREALAGLEEADSVTLDPHKWLFVPFECGCLLARDPERLAHAFRISPEYLKDVESDGEGVNFADYGLQLTRYARAFKIWLGVRHAGLSAIRKGIQQGIDLAAHAGRLVEAAPELEVLTPASFGILCFRVRPDGWEDGERLDRLNERVNAKVNAGGRFFISSTSLNGHFSLRICALGFRTTIEDIDQLIADIRRYGTEDSAGV